jgi:hypothetical protein
MSRRKLNKGALSPRTPLNFLLGCSESALGSFELSRLASVANLRSELHATLDKIIDEMAQAAVAGWFRTVDRDTLRQALENADDPIAWAQEQIRIGRKSGEELVPLTSLPPGAAHLAAALRYQENNVAKGLCAVCPQKLARNSVRYCERHLSIARAKHKPKGAKGEQPGTVGSLYAGVSRDGDLGTLTVDAFKSGHGRQPGTLKALAEWRTKQAALAKAKWQAKPTKRLRP